MRSSRLSQLVALVALLAACGARPPAPNVLIVVLDTFRADRLAVYGGRRGLTPFLDELAASGAIFERAYATSSWTSPSVASLFTSRHPLQHAIRDFDSVLGDGEVTLAEALRPLGWATAGFVGNPLLSEQHGYGQGFETWRSYSTREGAKARAAPLREKLLAWLDERAAQADRRPLLLYVQLMDNHASYDPPPRLRALYAPGLDEDEVKALNRRLRNLRDVDRFSAFSEAEVSQLRALYDGESVALDTELRRLFAELEARRFLDHAFVVITADHGEEFREHGVMEHGNSLFEPVVRVPLLVIGPGIAPGRRVTEPVSLVDLAPTLLELLGAPAQPSFEGRSLAPALSEGRAPGAAPAEVLFELPLRASSLPTQPHALGLLRGSHKLLVSGAGGAALYDLARDPDERDPATAAAESAPLVGRLEAERERLATRNAAPARRMPFDEETKEQLRALGYVDDPEEPAPTQPPPR